MHLDLHWSCVRILTMPRTRSAKQRDEAMLTVGPHSKKKVCYYYDGNVGNYSYGEEHEMKPDRITMTHSLILSYGLNQKMEIYQPHKATQEEITKFHSDDYIKFLCSIRPDNKSEYKKQMQLFNVGMIVLREGRIGKEGKDWEGRIVHKDCSEFKAMEDCPVFDGLFDFCQLCTGGSVAGAAKLNNKTTDIAVNWAGGLHHAKKSKASGFCYVNDVVLAIFELLKCHDRVLYVDIDVHHGDGVEEAFYTNDRVMTVSFHKYDGKFFPGTGNLNDTGAGEGKNYAVNFPLRDGIGDDSYSECIFQPVIAKVMEMYRPDAIVLQCGADSLTGDRLGCFNLTLKGHGKCVEYMKKFNLPLLILGGGGYTIKNVARCWTYETAVALGCDIANEIPQDGYVGHYSPDYKLHIQSSSKMVDQNDISYIEKTKKKLFENLGMLPHAPGVQMQDIPENAIKEDSDDEDDPKENNPDERIPKRASDKRIACEEEFSDSEDEGERGGRRNQESFKSRKLSESSADANVDSSGYKPGTTEDAKSTENMEKDIKASDEDARLDEAKKKECKETKKKKLAQKKR